MVIAIQLQVRSVRGNGSCLSPYLTSTTARWKVWRGLLIAETSLDPYCPIDK